MRPGLAQTLFDGLFLSQFRRYKRETLTRFVHRFQNIRTKFEPVILFTFEIKAFHKKAHVKIYQNWQRFLTFS